MNNTPQVTVDPVNTYLKDNSRKKSYAEATLDAVMHETDLEDAVTEVDEGVEAETERTGRRWEDEVQPPTTNPFRWRPSSNYGAACH